MMEPVTSFRIEPYADVEPYNTGSLTVSGIHQMYYEQCGNPTGNPVIFLHGGPGSRTKPRDRTFFDPEVYRVVLMDQRGAGKSTPTAELRENTTWDLVSDIEKLREHLGIDKWLVFGCSWGSALALAYAETHPDRVKAMVLGGIFALQRKEVTWVNQYGAHMLFPDVWEDYVRPIPEVERYDFVSAYYRRFTGNDEKVKLDCARAWTKFETAISSLNIGPVDYVISSQSTGAQASETDDTGMGDIQCATIECHYLVHGGFLEAEDQLLTNAHKLRNIPITIVQGRYDLVCPLQTAWTLHKELPHAEFHIIPDAGHRKMEPGSRAKLIEACEKYKHL